MEQKKVVRKRNVKTLVPATYNADAPARSYRAEAVDELGPVDTEWLKERLIAKGLNLRQAASLMGMHHSGLANSLKYDPVNRPGRASRRLQLHEAVKLANLIGVPLAETLVHLGVRMPAHVPTTSASVPVVGAVQQDGTVKPAEATRASTVSTTVPPAYSALRLYDLPGLDNAVAYLGAPCPPREAVSRLVKAEYGGVERLYFLRLGGEPDHYTLVPAFGDTKERLLDVKLEKVQPVLSIRL